MASVVYFLDSRGRPLLHRDYKWDIPSTAIEKFPLLLLNNSIGQSVDEGSTIPVLNDNGINYVYLLHKDLYILALTREDANVFSILCYLDSMVKVLEGYLKSLEEESIRDNFSVIYELLDEMMDFGISQITDQKILKEYITQESFTLNTLLHPSGSKKKPGSTTVFKQRVAPSTVTNAISWRSPGIVYKKNEAYLDVVEAIDMLVNSRGQLLSSEIHGAIKLKSFLSGMPELILGLNEKFMKSCLNAVRGTPGNVSEGDKKSIEVEDLKFHQCVRLGKFESEKMISFIPPDGECDLVSYRVHSPVLKPLFLIDYKVRNHSNTRLEIMLKVRANFKSRVSARKLEIRIPVPRDIDSPKYHYNKGTLKYVPNESVILWKFRKIDGGKEYVMIAELLLPSVSDDGELEKFKKIPINLKFEMQGFVTSGLQVKYLKIREPKMNYQSYPYVRYITKSGDSYEVRTN
ncbi:DEKNAAC103985 [Brettanomyces naardenensis]|uniref:DEKNAAC103985 n=1 Tax=Brettanomyces naardenensis TaxID=13370 RepID=A0A448YPM7_BRENA|nr:DEKNAAC103985 [Brettanomyces naardenensis]